MTSFFDQVYRYRCGCISISYALFTTLRKVLKSET